MADLAAVGAAGPSRMLQLARIFLLGASIFVLIASLFEAELKFFTLHPVLLCVWLFAATEAIVAGQGARRARDRESKTSSVDRHWTYASLALIALVFGVMVAYLNKEFLNKGHLVSYHGWAGASTVTVAIVQVVAGYTAYEADTKSPSTMRLIRFHRFTGYITFSLTVFTVFLSLYSNYVSRMEHSSVLWTVTVSLLSTGWAVITVKADLPTLARALWR